MFNKRLRELRKEHKLTQEELANKIGVSVSTVAMYESNKRDPSTETLNLLANLFSCTVDYLLGRSLQRNLVYIPGSSLDKRLDDVWLHAMKEGKELELNEDDINMLMKIAKTIKSR